MDDDRANNWWFWRVIFLTMVAFVSVVILSFALVISLARAGESVEAVISPDGSITYHVTGPTFAIALPRPKPPIISSDPYARIVARCEVQYPPFQRSWLGDGRFDSWSCRLGEGGNEMPRAAPDPAPTSALPEPDPIQEYERPPMMMPGD